MIQIQANISGYSGRPSTVLAALDEDSGVLVIARAVERIPRRDGCLLIESDRRADRDSLFEPGHLREAIGSYYTLKARRAADGRSDALRFSEPAMLADPSSHIESDGVDMNGAVYRVSPGATNASVAALAICYYAERSSAISDTVEMAEQLRILLSGGSVTI